MESKKTSPAKTICLVIGIFLTVIFFPLFLLLPLVGGAVSGSVNIFEDKNVENLIKSSEISSIIIEEGWKEAEKNFSESFEIKTEVLQEVFYRILTEDDINEIFMDTWKAMCDGKNVNFDFSVIEERLQKEMDKIFEELPEDLFLTWKGERASKYFTDASILNMTQRINDVFNGYTYEELKSRYEMTGATEPFETYIEKEWNQKKQEVALPDSVDASNALDKAKETLEKSINDEIRDSEISFFFRSLEDTKKSARLLYPVIYGILLIAALVLIALYFFAPGGFYVTGTGMLLGGIICGAFSALHGVFIGFVNGVLIEEMNVAGTISNSVKTVVQNIVDSILKTLETEIWKFGRVSCIIGIMLIGIGIFLHVMAKNKSVTE